MGPWVDGCDCALQALEDVAGCLEIGCQVWLVCAAQRACLQAGCLLSVASFGCLVAYRSSAADPRQQACRTCLHTAAPTSHSITHADIAEQHMHEPLQHNAP